MTVDILVNFHFLSSFFLQVHIYIMFFALSVIRYSIKQYYGSHHKIYFIL